MSDYSELNVSNNQLMQGSQLMNKASSDPLGYSMQFGNQLGAGAIIGYPNGLFYGNSVLQAMGMHKICDCGHIGEMHYGSKELQCNTNNCRCTMFRIDSKPVKRPQVGQANKYGGTFLSDLREEIEAWHGDCLRV